MESSIMHKLGTYINAELSDSALYRELARIAPNEQDRKLLLEFADDEQAHADEFKRIYRLFYGRNFIPDVKKPQIVNSYREILRDRVLDESGDFRKYGEQYASTDNPTLKNAYYRARTDENVHALRLLYMLSALKQ